MECPVRQRKVRAARRTLVEARRIQWLGLSQKRRREAALKAWERKREKRGEHHSKDLGNPKDVSTAIVASENPPED